MTANLPERMAFLEAEYTSFELARRAGQSSTAWSHLERAHIAAQPILAAHLRSHFIMLRYAVEVRDARETAGQVLRLALAALGNLAGKLPVGNTGRARVSAFAPMPLAPDLEKFL